MTEPEAVGEAAPEPDPPSSPPGGQGHRQRIRLLLEQAPAVLWATDRELRFTDSGGAGLSRLGLSPGEAVGRSLFQYFDTDDPDFLPIAMHRRALAGEAVGYETRWAGRSYQCHVRPLRGDDGEVVGTIGVALDITERREAEDELRGLLEQIPVAVFLFRERRVVYANSEGLGLLGASGPGDLTEASLADFLPGGLRRELASAMRAVEDGRRTLEIPELTIRRLDGEDRRVAVKAIPARYRGRSAGLAIVHDVTEERRAKEALRESEERYRRIFQDSLDVIYVTDRDGTIVDMNPAGVRLFGYSAEELTRMNAAELYHDPLDRKRFQEAVAKHGSLQGFEVRLANRDGEVIDCLLTTTARRDRNGRIMGYQGLIRDVTERKRFEERLERQALHDPLTGLPNRTLFWDRMEQALARARRQDERLAVLFVDLDRFKVVNDSLGHAAGDRVLRQVGRRLEGCVRDPDTVARVGGDEFTVLLERLTAPEDARRVADRIDQAMEQPFTVEGEPAHLGASIGIVIHDPGEEGRRVGADDLIRRADAAMYRAKERTGTHCAVFDAGWEEGGRSRLQEENELRRALEEKEFLLHYQPIISLETGRITAVEPLVRWHHPEHGILLPHRFLSLAEETGLIVRLGAWILESACRELAGRAAAGGRAAEVILHPNLSATQFEDPALPERLSRIAEATGIPPGRIELEVTEHVVVQAPERAGELKRLGFRIAVDDFGTGYSSLTYVKELEVDALKIDQEFVAGLERDRRDEAIVKTVLTLGETLGLEVVAEGIETAAQLAWLRSAGCRRGQGYFIARPMPAKEMAELLAEDPRLP